MDYNFCDQLYQILCQIKIAFNPLNQLNINKIGTSLNVSLPLKPIDALKIGTYDLIIPSNAKQAFERIMVCNGNDLCFKFDVNNT